MTTAEIKRDTDWGGARKFAIADEPQEIASKLIRDIPEHRTGRNLQFAEILWLYTSKPVREKGTDCIAKVSKTSELTQAIMMGDGDSEERVPDFVVIVSFDEWCLLDEEQRIAVIDHELCHMVMIESDQAQLRTHDLQEFREVVERRGLYLEDLRLMARSMQLHLPGTVAEAAVGALRKVADDSGTTVTLSSGGRSVEFGPSTHRQPAEREVIKADPDDPNSLDCTVIRQSLTPDQQAHMDTMMADATAASSR